MLVLCVLGVSNPPGRPNVTEIPRYDTPIGSTTVSISWTPPFYTGGVARPWFNVRNVVYGRLTIIGQTQGITLVAALSLFTPTHSVRVGVASREGAELSEWGLATSPFYYSELCASKILSITLRHFRHLFYSS